MVGRAGARRIPTAGAPDGHGFAVRDRGAVMAITAPNAGCRVGTSPPGPPGRHDDDRRPDLRRAAREAKAARCECAAREAKAARCECAARDAKAARCECAARDAKAARQSVGVA